MPRSTIMTAEALLICDSQKKRSRGDGRGGLGDRQQNARDRQEVSAHRDFPPRM
jgi:hypothetical protein